MIQRSVLIAVCVCLGASVAATAGAGRCISFSRFRAYSSQAARLLGLSLFIQPIQPFDRRLLGRLAPVSFWRNRTAPSSTSLANSGTTSLQSHGCQLHEFSAVWNGLACTAHLGRADPDGKFLLVGADQSTLCDRHRSDQRLHDSGSGVLSPGISFATFVMRWRERGLQTHLTCWPIRPFGSSHLTLRLATRQKGRQLAESQRSGQVDHDVAAGLLYVTAVNRVFVDQSRARSR
jgi:hypothetical protein